MVKKKFKETLIGGFLAKKAPKVLELIGDSFPPAKVISSLVGSHAPGLKGDIDFHELLNAYEMEIQYHLENTKEARRIYTDSKDITDALAKKIMNWNLPLILILVIINIVCVRWLDSNLLAIVSNVIGMVMQKLFEERSAVSNFFFGSSKGSKQKDNLINTK